jgi:chromate transporter
MESDVSHKIPGLREMFLVFFRMGAGAFGGPAMVTHIRRRIVEEKKWIIASDFDSGVALCQAIPGAVIMQLAAFCGLKIKGIPGAIVAFLAFGFPSFLLMFVLSILYKSFHEISWVGSILLTLRVTLAAIVAQAALSFGRMHFRQVYDVIIAVAAAILFLLKVHPALVILFASLLGIVFPSTKKRDFGSIGVSGTFRFFLFILGILTVSLILLRLLAPDLFTLSTLMLRVDLYSFGGGLAAVPIMYHEFVDIYGWFDSQTFTDGIVLGQITPGSVIITATFAGYLHAGVIGSLVATLSVFTPSFLILMASVPFYDRLSKWSYFSRIISGVLSAFIGLLAVVSWHFASGIHWDWLHGILAGLVFIVLMFRVKVIWVILGSLVFSLLFF